MSGKMTKAAHEIPVVYACNATYVPYLYISIASLVQNLNPTWKARVRVLHDDIAAEEMEAVRSLGSERVDIAFVNVNETLLKYDGVDFAVGYHFTKQTYYRFFLPEIFPERDTILYLDADTLVMHDVAELYAGVDLADALLGVTRDIEILRASRLLGAAHADYFTQTLGVQPEEYFQAGVMLMNLAQMRTEGTTQQLIRGLQKIGAPLYVDQDVLNMVCRGRVKYIAQNWDYTWHLPLLDAFYREHIGPPLCDAYEEARQKPYIIHFTGKDMKPENYPMLPEAKLFWKYADASPYAEMLRERSAHAWESVAKRIRKLQAKTRKNRLLARLPFGRKWRARFAARYKRTETELEALRRCGVPIR